MYTIKEACELTELSYQTLKFYCNEGLVPNVKRNETNYRLFDDRDVEWIKCLIALRRCGMSIKEMQSYTKLCLLGKDEKSIYARKSMLYVKLEELKLKQQEILESMNYIAEKQSFYDDVLENKIKYVSNLIELD